MQEAVLHRRKEGTPSKMSSVKPAAQNSPLAVLQAMLPSPRDLGYVKKLTTDDFTDVSLNYEIGQEDSVHGRYVRNSTQQYAAFSKAALTASSQIRMVHLSTSSEAA
jgi:hypothetical protein